MLNYIVIPSIIIIAFILITKVAERVKLINKTPLEREQYWLQVKLYKSKQKEFLLNPQYSKRLFHEGRLEVISVNQHQEIESLQHDIVNIENEMVEIKRHIKKESE